MADPRHRLGLAAEAAVERWLTASGWRIVARRCRPRGGGELDLVAIDPDGVLVGIEVRARRSVRRGSAAASVGPTRIDRLRRSLGLLAPELGLAHRGLRVDLVTVEPVDDAPGRWRLARLPTVG